MASDCARCDDDTRLRSDTAQAVRRRRCRVCGLPAQYELHGEWYCLAHYVALVQMQRGAVEVAAP